MLVWKSLSLHYMSVPTLIWLHLLYLFKKGQCTFTDISSKLMTHKTQRYIKTQHKHRTASGFYSRSWVQLWLSSNHVFIHMLNEVRVGRSYGTGYCVPGLWCLIGQSVLHSLSWLTCLTLALWNSLKGVELDHGGFYTKIEPACIFSSFTYYYFSGCYQNQLTLWMQLWKWIEIMHILEYSHSCKFWCILRVTKI